MKLYTKEMFLIAAEKCEVSMIDAKHIMQYIDEYVKPIELPSDEKIEQYADFVFPDAEKICNEETYIAYKGFIAGAEWLKEQIINQINL